MGCGAEVNRGQELLAAQLLWHSRISMARMYLAREEHLAGCSKSPDFSPAQPWRAETRLVPGKAAGELKPEAYPQWCVEDFDEPRTKLAGFFSILLGFGFAVIQMPMLPVEPGMAKFVGKNVAPSGHGQALAKINGFGGVVPDTVGICVPTVHVGIGKLAHGDPIAEGEHDSRGHAQHNRYS